MDEICSGYETSEGTETGTEDDTEKQKLPIRTIDHTNPTDTARHHKMIELVERMLELHKELAENPDDESIKKRIEETDNEIDALVYELYELTKEEIKTVEEAVR